MIVMEYGLQRPITNVEAVREQMLLASDFRNALVSVNRNIRDEQRELFESDPKVAAAKKKATDLLDVLTKVRKVSREYKKEHRTNKLPSDMHKSLLAANKDFKEARKAFYSALSKFKSANKDLVKATYAKELEQQKMVAKDTDTYWGTKAVVAVAVSDSRATNPLYSKELNPKAPKFKSFNGTGTLRVQIQGGLDSSLIFVSNKLVEVNLEEQKTPPVSNTQAKKRRGILRLRISSNEKREPVWAEWPILMHRPIADGKIKEVLVICKRIGLREEWKVNFIVDNVAIIRPCGYGRVAINFGWRVVDGGIRVGYAVDDEGNEKEFVVPHSLLSQLLYSDTLQSIRDKNFNAAISQLAAWKAGHKFPVWFSEATEKMSSWRSQNRLVALLVDMGYERLKNENGEKGNAVPRPCWKNNRFKGDEQIFDEMMAWKYRDQDHLYRWEAEQRTRAIRARNDMYRRWAASLAERYTIIIVGSHNMSETAKKDDKEDSGETDEEKTERLKGVGDKLYNRGSNPKSRSNRHLVAPSIFRNAVINAKRTRDGLAVEVPSKRLTKTCHVCERVNRFDVASILVYKCPGCDTEWDQDCNACKNYLAAYEMNPGDSKTLANCRCVGRMNPDGTIRQGRYVKKAKEDSDTEE